MNENDANKMREQLEIQSKALSHLQKDMAHIKNYFKWMLIGTVVTFVVPLIAAIIIAPIIIGKYMKNLEGLF